MSLGFLENQVEDEDYGEELESLIVNYKNICANNYIENGPDMKIICDRTKKDNGIAMAVIRCLLGIKALGSHFLVD